MTRQLPWALALLLSSACSAWAPPASRLHTHSSPAIVRNVHVLAPDAVDKGVACTLRRTMFTTAVTIAPFLATPAYADSTAATTNSSPKALSEDYRQGTAALADMDDQAPVPREAYRKLPSGVIYADLRPGTGSDEAKPGSRCNIQWVLRKSNGYFVDSSQVQGDVPFIFVIGDGSAIQGVDEGVRGMKVGGVRRLLIPPSLAYVQGLEDGMPGPLPQGYGPRQQMRRVQNIRKDVPGEYLYLEVQLTRLR